MTTAVLVLRNRCKPRLSVSQPRAAVTPPLGGPSADPAQHGRCRRFPPEGLQETLRPSVESPFGPLLARQARPASNQERSPLAGMSSTGKRAP
ncbi:hypothetical protein AVT14_gp05 [Mycobacterium phage Abrogate]|uniref:hypothetical protein n=1 Tax=Mycobacterium phage Abrogate TaxID=1551710 RepID=UPI00051A98C4|nr:hypothetical protein AVT14_gp05 [Mycobacterium phage Abrogate]AIT13149.1 hypothetical protein PBI_ABROGATE_50 [Mycobacterium phage Abrogate]